MEKVKGVLAGRIFLSSAQGEKLWFSLDENDNAVECISTKNRSAIARRILKNAERWLAENHER